MVAAVSAVSVMVARPPSLVASTPVPEEAPVEVPVAIAEEPATEVVTSIAPPEVEPTEPIVPTSGVATEPSLDTPVATRVIDEPAPTSADSTVEAGVTTEVAPTETAQEAVAPPAGTPAPTDPFPEATQSHDDASPTLRIESVRFSPVDPSTASPYSTGVITVSYTGASATSEWGIALTFSDFVSAQTGEIVPASSVTQIAVSGAEIGDASSGPGVIAVTLPAAVTRQESGAFAVTVRLDISDPVPSSTYRSSMTATITRTTGNQPGIPVGQQGVAGVPQWKE